MLKTRVITAVVMIVVLAGVLFYAPRIAWIIACALCGGVAAFEWARLTQLPGYLSAAFVLTVVLLVVGWPLLDLRPNFAQFIYAPATAVWLVLVPLWLWRHALPNSKIFSVSAGILLIGSASLALIALRDSSTYLVLCILGVVWVSDSMAYFVGSAMGRHKLAPKISPGKTWEGAAGGLFFVAIYAISWGCFSENVLPTKYTAGPAGWLQLSAIMLLLAVMGVYGDLFESLLKRLAGVKDSGKILPGHGGALDRIDALLPVLPVAAWIFSG
jgi:phosphatidate cytidylyltransferase